MVVIQPAHQVAQRNPRLVLVVEAPQRLLLLGVIHQVLAIGARLGRRIQLGPVLQPEARLVLQVHLVGELVPAVQPVARDAQLGQIARRHERNEHIITRGEGSGAVEVVETRRRPPRVQHADDAKVPPGQAHALADAVAAAEQLVVQRLGNHRHTRLVAVIGSQPGAAVGEWHIEHRKEIGGGGHRRQAHRPRAGLRSEHLDVGTDHDGLATRSFRLPQVHRIDVGHQRFRLGIAARGGIDLRVVQRRAAAWQWIPGQQMQHRQRGDAGTDAHADRQHHQRREYLVALQAAQCEVDVIAEHSMYPVNDRNHTPTCRSAPCARWLCCIPRDHSRTGCAPTDSLVITPTVLPPPAAPRRRATPGLAPQVARAATAQSRSRAGNTRACDSSRNVSSGTG